MRQPAWDKFEVALLIDACEKVNSDSQAKQPIVQSLSERLRNMAISQGQFIDDVFRNENGIALQMLKMDYLLTDGKKGLPGASKFYSEIVLLKNNDPVAFSEILKQAKKQIECEEVTSKTMAPSKDNFFHWLNEKTKLKASPNSIMSVLDEGSEYATKHGLTKKSFWDITEAKDFDFVCRKLLGMHLFRVMHRKAALELDKVYVYYKEYLALSKVTVEPIVDVKQPTNQETTPPDITVSPAPCINVVLSEDLFSEWMRNKGMADATVRNYVSSLHTAETFANEHGIENIKLTSDNATAISSIERMLANKEFVQFNQEQHNRFSAAFRKLRDFISESERHEALRTSDVELEVRNPILYQKLYSISKVYDDPQGMSVAHILSLLGMPISEEEVTEFLDRASWAVKVTDSVYSFSKKPVIKVVETPMKTPVNEEPSDFDKDEFIKVLMRRYQNGMQFDSIDLENFRDTYLNLFDKKLTYSDEQLMQRIKCCGVFYKDRLFPAEGIIDKATKEKLFAYIENSFAAGNKVLYYKSIYTDLADTFVYCFSLSDEKMLQAFIEHEAEKNKYYFYSNYMAIEKGVKIDPQKEISDYMLSAGKPLSYEEIYAGLSHISHDVIYREIQINSCFIRNEKEHYFHIDIFEFSEEDDRHISSLLNNEIEENGYAIWSRVFTEIQEQMPVFLENNLYLSSLGIRNALSRHMSNQYNFESEVISTHDKCLSMADVYSLYGKHHAPFSDDDIYGFSKEIGSVIYFGSLAEETVRVSRKLFVPKANVAFDTEAVDAALATYLSSGYILVRDVDSFLVFPNVGYEWNEFLLESYLRNYSKKFALINNGSSLNNVAGAVVKKDGEYTQFLDICAHALAESGVELKKEPALNYLAEINLITRRSYRELDSALIKARQIRNRKG